MNTRVLLQYRFHACRGMIASLLSVGQHDTRYANAADDQVQHSSLFLRYRSRRSISSPSIWGLWSVFPSLGLYARTHRGIWWHLYLQARGIF